MRYLGKLLKNNRGVGAIEYALVASLVSVAALAGYQSLGTKIEASYSNIDQSLDGKLQGARRTPDVRFRPIADIEVAAIISCRV